ncbi:MAG TPA: hypothetical protein PLH77_00580, partial [Bacilli bacterium]|nr:hypothetical protein [Bacilli bacterium]
NMNSLIHDLKTYPNQYSVYAFGEFVHYIDKNTTFNPADLETYLKKGLDVPKKVYREYQDYVQTLSHKYSDVRLTVEVFEEIHDKLMY